MAEHTKERMVAATVESLRRRGYAGTSFTEVLAASGAARGGVYHHFPGGKAELVGVAVAENRGAVSAALRSLPPARSAAELVDAFLSLVRPVVAESAEGAGCAVAAVATEAAPGSHLQLASGEALEEWCRLLAAQLVVAGLEAQRAEQVATLLITTLEGAHVLCRAQASIAPFDLAAQALRADGFLGQTA